MSNDCCGANVDVDGVDPLCVFRDDTVVQRETS